MPAPLFPPRPREAALIRHHLSTPHPPPLFLHGPPSCGILSSLPSSTPFTHIDCVLSAPDRALFAAVADVGGGTSPACDPARLIAHLRAAPPDPRLVFHRAERLAGPAFSAAAACLLFALPRLVGRRDLAVVFVSRLPWTVFRRALAVPVAAPLVLAFAPYAEHEAVDAIVAARNSLANDAHAPLFLPFVRFVVRALYPTTNDLRELRAACHALFPPYLRAYGKGGVNAETAAFNCVRGELAPVLRDMYRNEYGRVEENGDREGGEGWKEGEAVDLGLGTTSLTLLVAAFLAATNPPPHDIRYFTAEKVRRIGHKRAIQERVARGTNRRAKRGRGGDSGGGGRGSRGGRGGMGGMGGRDSGTATAASAATATATATRMRTSAVAGNGRAFGLERLLAIHAAIREVNGGEGEIGDGGANGTVTAAVSTSSLVQISTLVGLKYLEREGAGDLLAEPRFRCNVSLERARELARLARVELDHYLHAEPGM